MECRLDSSERGAKVEEIIVITVRTTMDSSFHWQMYLMTEDEDVVILVNMSLGLWVPMVPCS